MQPSSNDIDEQHPVEQSAQTSYSTPLSETPLRQPIVTLTSETAATPVVEQSAGAPLQEEPVHWQAHEYIHHDKSPIWFVVFAIAVLALMAAAIFLIQSVTFAILVPVMATALLVYTHRPPRVLDYTLSSKGLYINDQLNPFVDFKGFGVIHDGDEYSVMLLPVKRFKLGVSVYFPEEAGEAIVDMLGARLPMQELHLDVVDILIRKLRI